MERDSTDKIIRVLDIFSKLKQSYIINKAEEALIYNVNERSIQRDIDDILLFLEKDVENISILIRLYMTELKKAIV